MESERKNPVSGLAQRLCEARNKIGLKQIELSVKAGLDRKTCFNIETGKIADEIALHTVERLAVALNVSPAWLAFGEEDGETQVKDLLARVVEAKKKRLEQARVLESLGFFGEVPEEDDGEQEEYDDFDDEEADDIRQDRRERRLKANAPVWPYGFRPLCIFYPELMPLEQEYAPVFHALGPGLSDQARAVVGKGLLLILWKNDEESQRRGQEHARLFNEMLRQTVPEKDHAVVDRVMRALHSANPNVCGRVVLSLILDGGLPVDLEELLLTRDQFPKSQRKLCAMVNCVIEIMENLVHAGTAGQTLLPPTAPPSGSRLLH
jgi:transcriptional regulator with XRE-family HTH domain